MADQLFAPGPGQVDTVRCQATLRHVHGVTRCVRTPLHDDFTEDAYAPLLDQHLGRCDSCAEDGDPDPWLRWTGYAERWGPPVMGTGETPDEYAARLAATYSPVLLGPIGLAECGCPNRIDGLAPALHLCRVCGFVDGVEIHTECAGCSTVRRARASRGDRWP